MVRQPEPDTTSRPSPKVRHSGGKACKIAVRERGGRAKFRPPRRNGSMAAAKKIGILTGGGDVPGLNPVIKSVVYRGSEMGRDVIGIRKGWQGLTHMNVSDETDS